MIAPPAIFMARGANAWPLPVFKSPWFHFEGWGGCFTSWGQVRGLPVIVSMSSHPPASLPVRVSVRNGKQPPTSARVSMYIYSARSYSCSSVTPQIQKIVRLIKTVSPAPIVIRVPSGNRHIPGTPAPGRRSAPAPRGLLASAPQAPLLASALRGFRCAL